MAIFFLEKIEMLDCNYLNFEFSVEEFFLMTCVDLLNLEAFIKYLKSEHNEFTFKRGQKCLLALAEK